MGTKKRISLTEYGFAREKIKHLEGVREIARFA